MTAYSVIGTPDLSLDCTTANTGEPIGTFNGQPLWSWANDVGTWYLWFKTTTFPPPTKHRWWISMIPNGEPGWSLLVAAAGDLPDGDYPTMGGVFIGTATIAEVVEDESSSSSSESSGSSMSSSSSSSSSESSESSTQSSGDVNLPRSCTITVTGSFSFTTTVEKPT